jgi:hypothetical protein
MTLLKNFFIKPFTAKGCFWGTVDLLVKLTAAFVWVYLTGILVFLIMQSVRLDYSLLTQLWWFAYCFLIFFGASLLAYILMFMRDYAQEDDGLPEIKPLSE